MDKDRGCRREGPWLQGRRVKWREASCSAVDHDTMPMLLWHFHNLQGHALPLMGWLVSPQQDMLRSPQWIWPRLETESEAVIRGVAPWIRWCQTSASRKNLKTFLLFKTSLVAQKVKRLPTTQETWVRSLSWEDLLEKEMATTSSLLAWRIPWTEEPGGLQSTGLQRIGHDWASSLPF